MLENIGKATNKNPLIYASPKNFINLGHGQWRRRRSLPSVTEVFCCFFSKKKRLPSAANFPPCPFPPDTL
jgi:hypothetical protein